MKILKCIAIDDEPLALHLMETFIAQTPFLELLATCDNALDAMELLGQTEADLVFLDINMPKLSGMELARWMKQQSKWSPVIIFTTAYNHYAIEGYKVDAVDYLLKPFGYEEFLQAANKTLQRVEKTQEIVPAAKETDAFFVKVEYQWVKVYYDDICYIEGLKDYVKFHLLSQEKAILSLTSLKALEERLPSSLFMRVHRSVIVSLKKISSITKSSLFIGDKEISIGDQYRDAFRKVVDEWLG
ncbi:LytR/AlgR family response regulator transcription factor [Empedobacter brevis]|uniref:LytR/AlgR family response regulator transcription factor n=1 Tax=Empedobacter brevis TaxID=247 RepID=UPI003341DEA9